MGIDQAELDRFIEQQKADETARARALELLEGVTMRRGPDTGDARYEVVHLRLPLVGEAVRVDAQGHDALQALLSFCLATVEGAQHVQGGRK